MDTILDKLKIRFARNQELLANLAINIEHHYYFDDKESRLISPLNQIIKLPELPIKIGQPRAQILANKSILY
jgi:hypothetical protein